MDKAKMDYFKNKLIQEKKKMLSILNKELNTEHGFLEINATELSIVDNHPGDIGTEVFLIERNKGFKNQINNVLKEIEASLEDINNKRYGFCKDCGKRIDKDRLDIIPYFKNCIECAKREDFKRQNGEYHDYIDEKLLSFSINPEENVSYDREDTYQEVVEFNIVDNDLSYSTGDNMGIMDEADHGIVEDIEKISQEYYDETLD
ncbi:MAG TPA: TraR/DksA C4-type zinc finger protein [Tissierellaceae bacterium]|nr:TraR/DksA C4-type zinc finger protein [Tissierellaceae bacterium]